MPASYPSTSTSASTVQGISRSKSRHELQRKASYSSRTLRPTFLDSQTFSGSLPDLEVPESVGIQSTAYSAIKHFSSFCVLDAWAPGCPVTATSEDLRYIFDVGEQFFLHNQECDGTSLDIVTGYDAAGNEVTHLVLFSPLVSPSSGRSRFMLAALIDVTTFLLDTASFPDLETISEDSVEDEDLATPGIESNTFDPAWPASYELSAENLLGGCFVEDAMGDDRFLKPKSNDLADVRLSDDIWLNLATEEKKTRRRKEGGSSRASTSAASATSSAVDDILNEFMSNLQQLYSEFFLLAKSPLDDNVYEICNVSPSVNASKDYINGHLSLTPPSTIAMLSQSLAGDSAFRMAVRWGSKGQERQLYCIPLFGQSSVTWICVLVDVGMPLLW
jgi:hypothetical protein